MPEASPEKSAAELLVVGVTSPLMAGVYIDGRLEEVFESAEKTSKALPPLLHDVRYRYDVKGLYYAKGPGSFMAIKVTYVMLKTFSIALGIPLYAADAFAFNQNRPLKAVGRSCFVKRGEAIVVETGCDAPAPGFRLPKRLDEICFTDENEPLYILPAV
ncbi:hypothetical protein [Hydrogenimonas sp. SS33]|uniref:hypothetical protein n=1 Tax=Hydrogenimonas leucolamina TaxID=2954236 RepID=UPI00336C0501